ncbi:dienelactone hydrolase family protein [Demequina capsici]|uniref:Dienelactone hydrolase family protein n=1 Tax=Demequina capsici TaxID=3075620 RepID=A0AA96JD54_9MICO|nr:dienelactone hydrolase family protein [Demequina sp. OYTSA14]WNM24314.1 dienelactone hydrolase family protein [Demequina sp. OYTSA14]
MATVVLIHSALGLTPTVLKWADDLRAEGHDVITPDLYEGAIYGNLDEGVAHADSVPMSAHVAAARAAIAEAGGLGPDPVYAGFSLGAAVAQILALTDPDARGVVLMHGAMSPQWIDGAEWGERLTGQLHYAVDDPWCEAEEVQAFVRFAPDGALDEFKYDGSAHLFAFEQPGEYDAYQGALMHDRVIAFLAEL